MTKQALDVEISGLTADSRKVEAGYLFAALPGTQVNGADYIGEAINKGASAVILEPGVVSEWTDVEGVTLIPDANPKRLFSLIAARFFEAQPETIAAVTGTNGKTSVVNFTRQIWCQLGQSSASLGTLGVTTEEGTEPLKYTTPGPVRVQSTLRKLYDEGITHLAMEASSHGLVQCRMDGVELKAAAFTNLSQDHLDYHTDLEDYLFAKLRLFGEILPPQGVAVLNADMDCVGEAENICWARGQQVMMVGENAPSTGSHIKIISVQPQSDGQVVLIRFDEREYDIRLPLVGGFQASNALIAAGLVIACGAEAKSVFASLSKLEGVAGRMQFVGQSSQAAPIYIDYAHTPDALLNVLKAMRPHTEGKLHVVFGAGGDRDRGKRPLMGQVAAEHADVLIVTDDNPRSEKPDQIRKEVLAGCLNASSAPLEIGDRAEAIKVAINGLAKGDLLVVAGKGHETGQIIGDQVIPFNDAEVISDALDKEGGAV